MSLTVSDKAFLEQWDNQPTTQETKNRLKDIFSKMVDQSDVKMLQPHIHLLKWHQAKEVNQEIIGFVTFGKTLLNMRRLVLKHESFSFNFHDGEERSWASFEIQKRNQYLACNFYVDQDRDPYLPKGDRPLTKLVIRILKEIFARAPEPKLHMFISRGHTGPVFFAEGFKFDFHSHTLKCIHESAKENGRLVGEGFDPPNAYDAELNKPIELPPPLLAGTHSLL